MRTASRPRNLPDSKELRIALVCYGGVSLAIYMHGVTKEIQKLVEASAAYDADSSNNPFAQGTTERAYWTVLGQRASKEGVATRVIVDIISGTSAGGINGVVLAKALAGGLSQDQLKNLWMENADLEQLLDIDVPNLPFGNSQTRVGWKGISWLLGKGLPELRATLFDKGRKPRHPLRGDKMLHWIYEALEDMDQAAQDPPTSLMPDGHPLRLFVTVTDYHGYPKRLSIYSPDHVIDSEHRHVMKFRFDGGEQGEEGAGNQFGPKYNGALAFAARATSSFPGGFPPVSFQDVATYLGGPTDTLDSFFDLYKVSGSKASATYFVDGGILDNFPFGHAIDAVNEAPAHTEVERYLIFLEPDPGAPPEPASGEEPHWVSNIWAGLSRIPSKEPIIDDIQRVHEFNDNVARVSELIAGAEDHVTQQLDAEDLYIAARQSMGLAYDNYVWMKLDSVVDRLGSLAAEAAGWPDGSSGVFVVRDIIRRWARQASNIMERSAGLDLTDDQIAFLKTFDLDYGRRRLRFLIQGLNTLYSTLDHRQRPTRGDLDAAKEELYGLAARLDVDRLLASSRGRELSAGAEALLGPAALERAGLWGLEPVRGTSREPDDRVAGFVSGHTDELNSLYSQTADFLGAELNGLNEELRTRVGETIQGWDDESQRTVTVRFDGFPIWDTLVYPLRRFGDLGELYPINVVRFSPEDSTLISEKGAAKLEGTRLHHFGAFFDREGREGDYLWGRLDGAERLIGLLGGGDASLYLEAFTAIVDDERATLSPAVINRIDDALAERFGSRPTS